MPATKAKNFRFSTETRTILEAVCQQTGENSSRIVELCVSCYAMEIGVEVNRANQFLRDNILQRVAAHRAHAGRKGPQVLVSLRKP